MCDKNSNNDDNSNEYNFSSIFGSNVTSNRNPNRKIENDIAPLENKSTKIETNNGFKSNDEKQNNINGNSPSINDSDIQRNDNCFNIHKNTFDFADKWNLKKNDIEMPDIIVPNIIVTDSMKKINLDNISDDENENKNSPSYKFSPYTHFDEYMVLDNSPKTNNFRLMDINNVSSFDPSKNEEDSLDRKRYYPLTRKNSFEDELDSRAKENKNKRLLGKKKKRSIENQNESWIENQSESWIENQNNTSTKKKTKKLGRYTKEDLKNIEDDAKRHSREEMGNANRKMIKSCKKFAHKFNKKVTGLKLYEPTITEEVKGSHKKILKFLKTKFYSLYHDYTLPKRIKNCEKLRNIKDAKKKKNEKKKLMRGFQKYLEEIIKDKKIKAVLDLTLLDFLKIYLKYGYSNENGKKNKNKKIKINKKKYGFKTIELKNFTTYIEIKDKFSENIIKQENFRKNLLNFIEEK